MTATAQDPMRADFEAVCGIGADPAGGWTRPAYGPLEQAAHDWLAGRAREAGLAVRIDPAGNLIARREPAAVGAGLPAVALGSHLDTVRSGGAYDGVVGVLAGLEVIRRIPAPPAPLELIVFRDEEGRFGALTGSRAMTGALGAEAVAGMRDPEGVALTEAAAAIGLDPAGLADARRDPAGIAAFLELHIEQGPVLEEAGCPLGIVTAIAGQERMALRFTGRPDHAGTAPMHMRRDAFAAAARFADRFRDLVIAGGAGVGRGTIGIVRVSPGLGNVVPAEVRLGLEIRDSDGPRLTALAEGTRALAAEVAAQMGVELAIRPVFSAAPVQMAPGLRAALARAAGASGLPAMELLSGANHDAGILGAHLPAAMLFVPSAGGRSHCPEEATDWPHIAAAVDVLEAAVRDIAARVAGGWRPADGA